MWFHRDQTKVRLCVRCRNRPADPDNRYPDEVARYATEDPARYCSPECAEEGNADAAW